MNAGSNGCQKRMKSGNVLDARCLVQMLLSHITHLFSHKFGDLSLFQIGRPIPSNQCLSGLHTSSNQLKLETLLAVECIAIKIPSKKSCTSRRDDGIVVPAVRLMCKGGIMGYENGSLVCKD